MGTVQNKETIVLQILFVTSVLFCHVFSRAGVLQDSKYAPASRITRHLSTPERNVELSVDDDKIQQVGTPEYSARRTKLPHLQTPDNLAIEQSCGENKCKCKGIVADCSQINASLTFIPRLPSGVIHLSFTRHNLTAIVSEKFFTNVTQITVLDLSNNGLVYIVKTAFQCLVNLAHLTVRGHSLSYNGLQPLLSVHSLEYLDISQGSMGTRGPFPSDIFHRHPLPYLKTLCVNDNQIWSLNMSVFQPLVSLKHLHMGGNQISHQLHTASLARLEVLILSRNGIFNFPKTCSRKGKSLFPELVKLHLKNNLLSTLPSKICLPKLEILVLSSNMYSHLVTDMFNSRLFPSLLSLYLDDMSTHIQKIDKHAVNNSVLHVLSMMYNNIDFSISDVDPDCFQGLPNLEKLQMGHNFCDKVTSDRFLALFGSLTNLRSMAFGLVFIHNVTADMFQPFQFLKRLLLYDNEMTNLPDGVFDVLPNLRYLYLGGNRFTVVKETTFSPETRRRLHGLDLSSDSFQCTCDLLWFRQWLVSSASLFRKSSYTYDCKNLPGVTVQEFFMDKQACLLSRDTYAFIVATVSILILSMTLISTLFRFRWHLRLLLYEAFRGHGDIRKRRLQTARFKYDVFVSYASDDLPFVRRHLLPELEERLKLKVCAHDRDFIPGQSIVDNIVQCVEGSKKIMMIFSDSFVRSHWCQLELTLCLDYVMNYEDALVIVRLNDVASRDMTGAMMAVLKTTTYIQWSTEPEAVASFWGRIAQALHEILEHN